MSGDRLQGRRIVVTGAASGIGLATALLFRDEGARVAMFDRDADRLKQEAARLKLESFVVDVTDEAAVARAVDAAAGALGGLDGVVNSAGIDLLKPFAEMTAVEWRRIMSVDLDGPFFVCHAALRHLRDAGQGTIVNVASGAALRPLEHRTAYCSAKAALVMFSKTLAVDLADDNVRVNAICPGIIDTPLFRTSFETAPDPDAELQRIIDRYVIKRAGRPEDIASAALFLSCSESAYMTGSAIAVDGGRTFH
jgi:NAD(P)-dependent dehydrogenase (short-subunit alcohol dehydrogenase family)